MIRLFEGASRAQAYALSRPKTPELVAEKAIEYMKPRNPLPQSGQYDCLLDVGCGSGQSTAVFAPYFRKIIGIDPSEEQINEARKANKLSNIEFMVGQAEKLEGESCFDMVASGQAVHWVDIQAFFNQCSKVLKPNGCFVLHGYDKPCICPAFSEDTKLKEVTNQHFADFYSKCLFHPRRKHVDEHYQSIFEMLKSNHKIKDDSVENKVDATLGDFISYLKTWSGYQAYMKKLDESGSKQETDDILKEFISKLVKEWEIPECDASIPVSIVWNVFMILSERPLSLKQDCFEEG